MSDTKPVCPQCGGMLPADAPVGLCARCLMAMNLATQTELTGEGAGPQPAPKPEPLAPEEIAKHFPNFDLLECLGRGGMGVVYKARQKSLNRLVALKILAPERERDAAFAQRFSVEAETLAKLSHPNIVTIHDFGQTSGLFYLVMEFVDGVTLRQLLQAGRVSPREALAIVPQICDALQFAHDQDIVHRDIKPDNILLDRRGRVKVADFGLAKLVGAEPDRAGSSPSAKTGSETCTGAAAFTDAGKVMGTPQYMAPEQTEHPGDVDHRADIYALGVVFYQMLTGELPGKRIEPPSNKVHIDVRLDEVVLRALEQKPELRFQQVSVFKTEVETIATTPGASDGFAPAPNRLLKTSPCYVRTPEHLRTVLGRILYTLQAKGELRLDEENLSFDSGWSVVEIPLSSVRALAIGWYRVSVIKIVPLSYLSVTFTEHGDTRTLLFTPTPPLNSVWAWMKYHLNPRRKILENSAAVRVWSDALQGAYRARTGQALPLGPFEDNKHRSRWDHVIWFCLWWAFLVLLGKRPLLDILSEQFPGPITSALAAVSSMPWGARAAVRTALSIIDAGLFLFLMMLLVQLCIQLSGKLASMQWARSVERNRGSAIGAASRSSGRVRRAILGGGLVAAIAIVVALSVRFVNVSPRSDLIGQTDFPQGDSITIRSVDRTGGRMVVKGHYNLVSRDRATLALYITSTNRNASEGKEQRMEIARGRGVFELIHSHIVPGLPHVEMYADGTNFANVYFGTKAEALEESKVKWFSGSSPRSSDVLKMGPASRSLAAESVVDQVQSVFGELSGLKGMTGERQYELEAGGGKLLGNGDDFLRRRTGPEILASGLSSGCGDYAIAFAYLMDRRGFQTLFIDSAEVSLSSLKSHFSGHVVVAVLDPVTPRWLLADPTSRRIISNDWSPNDRTFYQDRYWIGYCGALKDYPVHSPEELKGFYRRTLQTIPPEFWNQHVVRFSFKVDSSLIASDGTCLNPNVPKLTKTQEDALAAFDIQPEREITVLLVKGGDDARSTLTHQDERGWVCTVGLRSACSLSFVNYMQGIVASSPRGGSSGQKVPAEAK